MLIMTIGPLPDAMKPGFHCVLVFRTFGRSGLGGAVPAVMRRIDLGV
jgi:hypothetical protein